MRRRGTGSGWRPLGKRNKVMKLLDMKDYDPTLIEYPALFTVEISRYQKYGDLLKNSVESYPLRDKMMLVMKDMAGVEQAMGAVVSHSRN
jgi:hypothetical protein